jgi:hypothetical protein
MWKVPFLPCFPFAIYIVCMVLMLNTGSVIASAVQWVALDNVRKE